MTSARGWHLADLSRTAFQLWFEGGSVAWRGTLAARSARSAVRRDGDCSCRLQRLRRPSGACVRPELGPSLFGERGELARCPGEDPSSTDSNAKLLTWSGLAPSLPTQVLGRRGSSPPPRVPPRPRCRDLCTSPVRRARVTRGPDSRAWVARASAHRADSARLRHAITRAPESAKAESIASGATA
jgi:hypothetical protein